MKIGPMNKRILVTGQSGFIGTNLVQSWKDRYHLVPVSFRGQDAANITVEPGDVVVHLAGIAHQLKKTDPSIYYEVNHSKTIAFARRAKEKGASHFIYASSTKVYGDHGEQVINETTDCRPDDAYGKSKLLAERDLLALQTDAFPVSLLRPPLVYGAGVKGNMLRLLQHCASGRILPFKGVNNQRSIVYVGNLLAMLQRIIEQRKPGIFIPADDRPLSTFQMLRLMKDLMHTKNAELGVPAWLVQLVKKIKPGLGNKVFGSLVYDNKQSREQLQFANPFTTEQGFQDMVQWFRQTNTVKA